MVHVRIFLNNSLNHTVYALIDIFVTIVLNSMVLCFSPSLLQMLLWGMCITNTSILKRHLCPMVYWTGLLLHHFFWLIVPWHLFIHTSIHSSSITAYSGLWGSLGICSICINNNDASRDFIYVSVCVCKLIHINQLFYLFFVQRN